MGFADISRHLSGWRAALARWLVLCVVLRALVPVGFMPSFGTTGDDGLHLVFCAPDGPAAFKAAAPGAPGQQDNGTTAHDQCVFSFLPHLGHPGSASLVVNPPPASAGPLFVPNEAEARRISVGPQVGARAPPLFS